MDTPPNTIDEWIGHGKKYRNVPKEISNELLRRLALSEEEKALIPAGSLCIPQLLEAEIPRVETLVSFPKKDPPASCFTSTAPNCSLADIAAHRIPHDTILTKLRSAAGQAMLDGCLSLKDWRDKTNTRFLPFSALTYWRHLHDAALAKEKWEEGLDWLRKQSLPLEIVDRAMQAISRTQWQGTLKSLDAGIPVTSLATFLSEDMLNDDNIDAMLRRLEARLDNDPKPDLHVDSYALAQAFTNIPAHSKAYPKGAPQNLLRAAKLVGSADSYKIFASGYSDPYHWVGYIIEKSPTLLTVHWGDSLPSPRPIPKDFKIGFKKWASVHFKQLKVVFDESLPHGVQRDGNSCGIISVNTLKHALFHEELWAPKRRVGARVSELLDILEYHLDHIEYRRLNKKLVLISESFPPAVNSESDVEMDYESDKEYIPSREASPEITEQPQHDDESAIKRPASPASDSSDLKMQPKKKARKASKKAIPPTPSTDANINISEAAGKKPARSGTRKKALNDSVNDGTFEWNQSQLDSYKAKLAVLDPHFKIFELDPTLARFVEHSKCKKRILMATVYDISRFKSHLSNCEDQLAAAKRNGTADPSRGTQNILQMFGKQAIKSSSGGLRIVEGRNEPCPGLSGKVYPRVQYYLEHTQVVTAGGTSETKLAKKMYDMPYRDLSNAQKTAVTLRRRQTHTWENDRIGARVFAIGEKPCLKTVWHASPDDGPPPPCANCKSLFSSQPFQNAISRERSEDENVNFTPLCYRDSMIANIFSRSKGLEDLLKEDSDDHLFSRFVKMYAKGRFEENDAFLGLLEVMTTQEYRKMHGKGLQNMYYPPAFDTLCLEIRSISPAAYRQLQATFGGRSERSFQAKQAASPRFIQGIGAHTGERARTYITQFGYPADGPLGCAVDDTKLLACCRPVFNSTSKQWFLVGGIGDPVLIADLDNLQSQINELRKNQATKMRLWTLVIPLPGIPPLLLAATAIGSKNTASDLAEMEKRMLDEVVKGVNVNITSLASDGATVEREARRLLVRSGYAQSITYTIPHPQAGYPDMHFEILKIGERYISVVQDSKHLRKTLRNNLFSGAKALVLGNYVISFQDVWNMAHSNNSPIYLRDVKKLDRQDDRAAARLFSAQVLEHLVSTTSNLGLVVYLYVFGDLIDAYQSRTMSHRHRVKIALRAKFFKDLWKSALRDSGYATNRHFLSPEADDITDILINGLMGLEYIYRDKLESRFPLLLWWKSSEANEHCFGGLREMTPDFTFADVLFLIPKLSVRLMAACKRKIRSADFRKRASGYMHTYADGTNANLHFLRLFPSDREIQAEAATAWDEALALWEILGYFALDKPTPDAAAPTPNLESVPESLDDTSLVPDSTEDAAPSDAQQLQDAVEAAVTYQETCSPLNAADTTIDQCSFAAAALNIAQLETIEKLPDDDPEQLESIRDALAEVLNALAAQGPSAATLVANLIQSVAAEPGSDDEDSTPTDEVAWTAPTSLPTAHLDPHDLSPLVEARRKTQSKECAQSVRFRYAQPPTTRPGTADKNSDNEDDEDSQPASKPESTQQVLARKIHDVIRIDREQLGTSTGLNRLVRHTTAESGAEVTATGNAANARRVANTSAASVITHRRNLFKGLVLGHDLADARFNAFTPLEAGKFGVVMYEGELMVAKVITLYERSNGKAARHNHVVTSASIGAISYIVVQLWQNHRRSRFRALFGQTKAHNLPRYAHMSAGAFLYMLPNGSCLFCDKKDTFTPDLNLSETAFEQVWCQLEVDKGAIKEGVDRLLAAHRKKVCDTVETSE